MSKITTSPTMFEMISATAAAERGLSRYFTGKACRNGHVAERMVSNRSCVVCLAEKMARRRTPETRQKERAAKRLRIERDPALKAHINALQRANHARRAARRQMQREEVAGRPMAHACEVCNAVPTPANRIVYDHSHAHGHFRGWLCDRCNKVLGLMKDDPVLLRSLAQYLENDDEQAQRKAA